jgi:hypothetical protein
MEVSEMARTTPTAAELERAIVSVPGVADATVHRDEDSGRSRLRLRLDPGEDADSISWSVAATLRERFGIALDPDAIRPVPSIGDEQPSDAASDPATPGTDPVRLVDTDIPPDPPSDEPAAAGVASVHVSDEPDPVAGGRPPAISEHRDWTSSELADVEVRRARRAAVGDQGRAVATVELTATRERLTAAATEALRAAADLDVPLAVAAVATSQGAVAVEPTDADGTADETAPEPTADLNAAADAEVATGAAADAEGTDQRTAAVEADVPPATAATAGAGEEARAPVAPPPVPEQTAAATPEQTAAATPEQTAADSPREPREPSQPREERVRAAIRHLDTQRDDADVRVTATLELEGRIGHGRAIAIPTSNGTMRAVAEATVAALRELVEERLLVGIDRITLHPSAEPSMATVVVTLLTDRGEETLLGGSIVRGDPERAVMRATLDALNRRIAPALPR